MKKPCTKCKESSAQAVLHDKFNNINISIIRKNNKIRKENFKYWLYCDNVLIFDEQVSKTWVGNCELKANKNIPDRNSM